LGRTEGRDWRVKLGIGGEVLALGKDYKSCVGFYIWALDWSFCIIAGSL